ncbi:MAG: hypothetical protein K2L11_01530 [Muribaculaceae bacterium]|nr:hypothetical protein [Muribaculaceae bacterium]
MAKPNGKAAVSKLKKIRVPSGHIRASGRAKARSRSALPALLSHLAVSRQFNSL